MKFIVVATLALFSLTLRTEKKPPTPAKLFTDDDLKVVSEASDAIGLKPFKSLEGKKVFMLADFTKELHNRLEVETAALLNERSKVDVVSAALTGSKTDAEIAAKVKASGEEANKATAKHFTEDAEKLKEDFQKDKAKVDKALQAAKELGLLDPVKSALNVKALRDELNDRTKKHEAALKDLEERKGRVLKQNKEFYAGLPKQIQELQAAKDKKAFVQGWNNQREAMEDRVQKLTVADNLIRVRELEMLEYANSLLEAIAAFKEKETGKDRLKWLDETKSKIDTIVLQPYSTAFFIKDKGQWGFTEEMNRRFDNLQQAAPVLGMLNPPKREPGKPSAGRPSGTTTGGGTTDSSTGTTTGGTH